MLESSRQIAEVRAEGYGSPVVSSRTISRLAETLPNHLIAAPSTLCGFHLSGADAETLRARCRRRAQLSRRSRGCHGETVYRGATRNMTATARSTRALEQSTFRAAAHTNASYPDWSKSFFPRKITEDPKTLAHRVAHLVINGADPHQILLLTFTHRARQ